MKFNNKQENSTTRLSPNRSTWIKIVRPDLDSAASQKLVPRMSASLTTSPTSFIVFCRLGQIRLWSFKVDLALNERLV